MEGYEHVQRVRSRGLKTADLSYQGGRPNIRPTDKLKRPPSRLSNPIECASRQQVLRERTGGCSPDEYTYGTPKTCPVPPDHPQNPLGPYGRSKYAAEKILLATESIRATIFRPRLITGPGRLGILGRLFTLIKAGLPVPMIGSGTNRYQMVGVGDCARTAILEMAAGCPSGPFNLGSAEPPTTRELLQKIIEHAKSHSRLIPLPAGLLKPVLGAMDAVGLTLLFPEQFGIADIDISLVSSKMNAAYDTFAR